MGPFYGALIFVAWAIVHIYSLFAHSLADPIWQTLALIAVQCWLYTGLFIVAHDTMHGSFAPGKERVNAFVGTAILFIYAGFNWRTRIMIFQARIKTQILTLRTLSLFGLGI